MIKGFAEIKKGVIYLDPALDALIKGQEGSVKGELMFIPYDKPHHWLYKYYRGYLIPDICSHTGDADQDTMHWYFKTKFLTREVKDLEEIPSKHRKTARIIRRSREIIDYSTGQIIETVEYYQVTYSTATITGKEFREYIQQVELFFMDFLGGALSKHTEDEGMQYREQGFKDE